jgi:hypothetical protein
VTEQRAATAGAVGRSRLTDVERAERKVTEAELQRQVTDLAVLLGWSWMHVVPGMRSKGRWWTATTGPLSHWPDLTLVRQRDRRLIFAELKRELEVPTMEQQRVLHVLAELAGTPQPTPFPGTWTRVQAFVWRPSDLRDPIETSRIYEVLR